MLLKILILSGAVGLIWMFIFRSARGAVSKRGGARQNNVETPRRSKVKDLVKCPGCGIFLPIDRTCDCGHAP